MTTTDLQDVRDALHAGHWAEALRLAEDHDPHQLGELERVELWELRAQAAYGCGEFEAAVGAWERLHADRLEHDDPAGAARAAAMVAMYLMMDTGLMAPVRGWLATADRLLEGSEPTPAHAIVAMTRTYERFMCGDMDTARSQAASAIELGRSTGVNPAVVIGMTAGARIRIFDGDVAGGLGQLDEVGAMLMAGRADPLTTGMMYCELICAAQGLGRHDMAAEWTTVMERWRHDAAVGGINGRCRVHRAEILRVSGPSEEAEAEALGACDELRPWMRREFGWPLAELGTIRLRRGDLDGAEEAFGQAHEHAWTPHPGMALVRLARGDVDAAMALITEAVDHPLDIPSKERPPFGDLRLAPLLDAQAEIAYAAGAADVVRGAAERLESIADRFPGPFLRAWADLAAARAHALEGDTAAAARRCSAAVAAWTEIGAPYEAAAARVVLGHVFETDGQIEAARLEWSAAAAGFTRFGAPARAREAAALAAGPGHAPTAPTGAGGGDGGRGESGAGGGDGGRGESGAGHLGGEGAGGDLDGEEAGGDLGGGGADGRRGGDGPGDDRRGGDGHGRPPETRVVRFVASGRQRQIDFGGRSGAMRDLKGLRFVARLVASPGREFHVLDLVAGEEGVLRPGRRVEGDAVSEGAQSGLPALDDAARESYRRRLAEIEDDIAEARRCNDPARAELAERDRSYLVAELRRAVGLGGRRRTVGGSAERARTSVARTIRYALDQLADPHEDLAAHLRSCVHTGTYCSYRPDPMSRLEWHLSDR